MINQSICYKIFKWFFKFLGFFFLLETLCSSHFCQIGLNLDLIALHQLMQHDIYIVHASYSFFSLYFCANLQSALGFVLFCFFFFFLSLLCFVGPYPSTMPRKTRANRVPFTPSVSPSRSQLFKNDRCREAFKKLNSKCKIWAEHSVILDEVDPAIRANLESRGQLSLLEIDHPPPTILC